MVATASAKEPPCNISPAHVGPRPLVTADCCLHQVRFSRLDLNTAQYLDVATGRLHPRKFRTERPGGALGASAGGPMGSRWSLSLNPKDKSV